MGSEFLHTVSREMFYDMIKTLSIGKRKCLVLRLCNVDVMKRQVWCVGRVRKALDRVAYT